MSKIHWDKAAVLAPLPAALVSCGSTDGPNLMTAAWTGIISSKPPKTYVSVRPERFSHDIIKKTGEFVINLPGASLVRAVDLCGVISGRDGDKFKKAGLTPERSDKVSAPSVAECPISVECRVTDVVSLGSHDMFVADIVGIGVDEAYLDKNGRLDIEKCDLLCYAHGSYFGLSERLGTFGFSVRKKPAGRPRKKVRTQKK